MQALLSLCSDDSVSAKSALDLCVKQMKNVLSSQQLPENASMEIIGRAYHATETLVQVYFQKAFTTWLKFHNEQRKGIHLYLVKAGLWFCYAIIFMCIFVCDADCNISSHGMLLQGLLYAKSLLRKIVGGSDLSSNSERSRDIDDASSDAGSSSVGSQSTDELSEVLSQADVWLGRAELLQSLLGSGIAASLDDIADKESSARLRDRLIVDERYSMAVYTCKKCKVNIIDELCS